jgi:ElaB/YqjD/DUF883 family membrane-anchored ribosome-binding protein
MIMKNRLADDIPLGGKEPGSRGGEGVADQALKYVEAVEKYIVDHPVPALAVALATGVMVAWWIKRR